MSNRYWVGGTGNWNNTAHWSTSSGGSGGASLPTGDDNVFLDTNSGLSGQTITLDGGVDVNNCGAFTSTTGTSYNVGGDDLVIYSNAVFESGISFVPTGEMLISFGDIRWHPSSPITVKSNGVVFANVRSNNGGSTITLLDDLTITASTGFGQFLFLDGTFDANGHNVTADNFLFNSAGTGLPAVIMGSGTWEATGGTGAGTEIWTVDENDGQVIVFTAQTSTIKLSGGTGNFNLAFGANSTTKTFNNILITGANKTISFSGTSVFNDFTVSGSQNTLKFPANITTTVGSFNMPNIVGNLTIIDSNGSSNQHTFSKSSGTVSCNYLSLSHSNATGGATWYAGVQSINNTNNSGWIFSDPPVPVSGAQKAIGNKKFTHLKLDSL